MRGRSRRFGGGGWVPFLDFEFQILLVVLWEERRRTSSLQQEQDHPSSTTRCERLSYVDI